MTIIDYILVYLEYGYNFGLSPLCLRLQRLNMVSGSMLLVSNNEHEWSVKSITFDRGDDGEIS